MNRIIIIIFNITLCVLLMMGCGGGGSDSGPSSSDATLSNLNVQTFDNVGYSDAGIYPVFNSEVLEYEFTNHCSLSNVSIQAVATDPNATITIDGIDTVSGDTLDNLYLQEGENIKEVVVTAEDDTQRTYKVKINCLDQAELMFDGFYQTYSQPNYYLRFYEEKDENDVNVIAITSHGSSEAIKTWFNRNNSNVGTGTYTITPQSENEIRTIHFTIEMPGSGKIIFEGIILANRLYLDFISKENDYAGTLAYSYITVDLTGLD